VNPFRAVLAILESTGADLNRTTPPPRRSNTMDPNAALALIRGHVATAVDSPHDDARELAEAVDGLDEWLTKGGFPPTAWVETPVAFPSREKIAETIREVGGWRDEPEVWDDMLDLADSVLALFTESSP
jgi:hypothetical protein